MKTPKILSVIFFVFGVLAPFHTHAAVVLDRVVAVVVDEPILQSEVRQLQTNIQANPAMAAAYRLETSKLSFENVLDRMIEEKVVKVAVKDLDIQVADSEIETQINAIAKQNNITRKQLEDSVRQEGLNFEEYKKNIRGQLERRNLFDRELRRGGGITESEVKSLYEKSAPVELKVSVISVKNNAQSKKIAEDMIRDVKERKRTIESISSEFAAENLGWLTTDSINPKFGNLSNLAPGELVGPILIEGQLQILIIEGNRRGSLEGFEKAKTELMMQAQAQDFDRRFQSWLEKKKGELNIVMNKL